MTCCLKIKPYWVRLASGAFRPIGSSATAIAQDTYTWSPWLPEADFSSTSAWQYRQDWDDAFDGMDYNPLAEYPDELKQECYAAIQESGAATFTFRGTWPDSFDCEGDGEGDFAPASVSIIFDLEVCQPITLKAVADGRVATGFYDELHWPSGWFPGRQSGLDLGRVWVRRFISNGAECDNDLAGYQLLASGHEKAGGEPCGSTRRLHCGVTQICEGRHRIEIEIGSGDGINNKDGEWEITLTFACGDAALDCDDEEADPDYDPPEDDPDDPCDPDALEEGEECPPPGEPLPRECYCGHCLLSGIRATVEGFVSTSCSYLGGGAVAELHANLNGEFELVWNGSEYAQELGILGNQATPGILVHEKTVDTGTPVDLIEYFCYRVTGSLACTVDGGGVKWTGQIQFWIQCRERDSSFPTGTFFGCGADAGDSCLNFTFSKLVGQVPAGGCDGSVTYSNDNAAIGGHGGNLVRAPDPVPPHDCSCLDSTVVNPPGSIATVKLEPIGIGGECGE